MSRKEQNFHNHVRLVPGFHYFTYTLILVILGFGVYSAIEDKFLQSVITTVIGVTFLMVAIYARYFALKAQDRAIRAEENLRHFVMTGKLLPKELRLGQIIALRFASDEEWLSLIQKSISEKMKPIEIKKSIKNWRADYHRV